MSLTRYRKSIAALVGAVLTWGVATQPDGITGAEWWGLAVAVATALGVYGTTNEPDDRGAVEPGSLALGVIVGVVVLLLVHR